MQLTIIVTSFNTQKYIAECFESILAQNINFDYEVIVGDDGSSDGTIDIIRQYESKFKNFSYFVQDRDPGLKKEDVIPSIRVSNMIFKAMSMAKGDYVNLISSDDYFVNKTFFNNALDFLQKHKSYAGFVGNFYFTYPDGRKNFPYLIEKYKRFIFWSHHYIHISCFVYKNLSNTNTLLKLFCDDTGMQYSIGLNGKLKYTSDFVFAYRQQEKSITHTQADDENAFLHMLFIQDVLNKKCPSLSKIYAYYYLFLFTPWRFSFFFLSLYRKKEDLLNANCLEKYANISRQYDNDIITALLNPSVAKNKKLLNKLIKMINLGNLLAAKSNRWENLCALPVPAYDYPISNKNITYTIEEFIKQKGTSYIKGWAFCEDTSSEIYIKANGRFYKTNMYSRPDIKEARKSKNISEGFNIKIHDIFDSFELYLFDLKNKCAYIQLCKRIPMQKTQKTFFIKQFIYDCICKFGSITNKSVMSELARMQQQGQVQATLQEQLRQAQTAMQEQRGQAQIALREQLNQTQEQLRQMQTAMQEQLWQIGQLEQKNNLLEKKLLIYETQSHYSHVRQHIQERLSRGEKLRFASYVIYDSNFGAHGICRLMLKEPEKYDVKFVICPDVYRDMDGLKQYHKTKQAFIDKYGKDSVLDGYDEESGEFLDWSSDFDIVYTANKYDCLVNKVHGINYLCGQDLLTIYIEYAMHFFDFDENIPENTVDSCLYYKYFLNSQERKRYIIRQRICNVSNIVVSGYPKVDQLAVCEYEKPERKRILIAPHQSVKGVPGDVLTSQFLTYSSFLLELPDLFTDIDFVFRPHPLLFKHLVMYKIWTQEQVDEYINAIKSRRFIYSTEPDYFHHFHECDAIIHDCCSFMGEWLFTGKPCCYVIESESATNRLPFNKAGELCLKSHTILADTKEKIIEFIEKVRHGEFETKISPLIREKIMINYPHASEYVLEHLLD